MQNDHLKVCTKCVMDTTDPNIVFDDNGICNHCLEFEYKTKLNGGRR